MEELISPPPAPRRVAPFSPGSAAEKRRSPIPAVAPRSGGLDIFLGHAQDGQRVNWSPGQLTNGDMISLGGSGAG